MTAALIQYALAKRAKEQRRRARSHGPVEIDTGGNGVVVFDVETTHLIDDETPLEEMEVSVACTVTLNAAASDRTTLAQAEHDTYWHSDAQRPTIGRMPLERMLTRFDSASMIVAYNGREFDMRVLARVYGGDGARYAAHLRKLVDPMEAIEREAGRRVRCLPRSQRQFCSA